MSSEDVLRQARLDRALRRESEAILMYEAAAANEDASAALVEERAWQIADDDRRLEMLARAAALRGWAATSRARAATARQRLREAGIDSAGE
jgi:hypothetical protein